MGRKYTKLEKNNAVLGAAIIVPLLAGALAYFVPKALDLHNTDQNQESRIDLRQELLPRPLRDFPNGVNNRNVVSIMYDFTTNSLYVLNDLTSDIPGIDHMEVINRNPDGEYSLSHMYINREISPNARESEHFHLVDQSFFDTFNNLIGRSKNE